MKIVKLLAENVKRLHAVEITPDGTLVTIGGKNGAGKSSVLDSIAYAMGGERLVPTEPIRQGEYAAQIVVDLGELIVTRKFKRTKLFTCKHDDSPNPVDHLPTCPFTWSDTTSTLTVTNRDGARYPSPQAVLDKMLGQLTFDPLAFARADPQKQDATLRKLVNLDVTPIENRRRIAFEQRAIYKKQYALKEAQVEGLLHYADVPTEPISMDAISKEMLQAEEQRLAAEEAKRTVERVQGAIATCEARDAELRQQQLELQRQMDRLQANTNANQVKLAEEHAALVDAELKAKTTTTPDMDALRVRVREAEATNERIRHNQYRAREQGELTVLAGEIAVQQKAIADAEDEKRAALEAVQFPVAGLGLSDDGVTFNGLPFDQASTSERIRTSVAIGIALNPKFKVLLIRDGNALDKDSLAAVAAQAGGAQMQLWVEWVTAEADGVSIFIEDGAVA